MSQLGAQNVSSKGWSFFAQDEFATSMASHPGADGRRGAWVVRRLASQRGGE